ncbi:MAG: mannose-1-phosphate guanyltransferase [Candidatus Bathyarchaeia archaeon]
MQAVVMAGGEGTRLRPLTTARPKPMVPVVNKPMMEHVLELLLAHRFNELFVTLHYLPDAVRNYFGDGTDFGAKITYSIEEKPLGTAGGVKRLEQLLEGTFLVISGDVLTDINLSEIVKFHKKRGAIATITLSRVPNPLEYGIVITNAEGQIENFLEKPGWGEVFSDTVNAGIYVLEPEALRYVKPGQEFDFSRQLFPLLLKQGEALYGYTSTGYWCDIGSVQQYLQAHRDILSKKVKLKIPGKEIENSLWVGEGALLEDDVFIKAPAVIGRTSRIRGGVKVKEFSVIGNDVLIDEDASIKRSIIWNNAFIGSSSDLVGCIIGERCNLSANVAVLENAVVADECILGQGSMVKPGIRIWPGKMIEVGSTVSTDLRWGMRWMKNLFGSWGLTGLSNIEITPEFAAKLGAAYGTFLGKKTRVVIGRDTHTVSRMIKRALIAGLNSVGVSVYNLRIMPAPLIRCAVRSYGADGGISVRVPQIDPSSVNIQFFDSWGINLDRKSEKKIEDIFFKEDIRRVFPDEVGEITYPVGAVEYYRDMALKFINRRVIEGAKLEVVLDCANGSSSLIAPSILEMLGCKVTTLNARMDEQLGPTSFEGMPKTLSRIASVVRAVGANVGIAIDGHGDRILLVDENGNTISGDTTLAFFTKSILEKAKGGKIVIPVTASRIVDHVAKTLGGEVYRTKVGAYPLLDAILREKAIFGGEEGGGLVFPDFMLGYDGIISAGKLLETLATSGADLSELVAQLPRFFITQEKVQCPWEFRGKIMRDLLEEVRDRQVDTMDGIKIFYDSSWILLLPSPEEPVFNIYAEAVSKEEAEMLVHQYANKIRGMID